MNEKLMTVGDLRARMAYLPEDTVIQIGVHLERDGKLVDRFLFVELDSSEYFDGQKPAVLYLEGAGEMEEE